MSDVEVEYLPKIGEAYTPKTVKQGRRVSENLIRQADADINGKRRAQKLDKNQNGSPMVRRNGRYGDKNVIKSMCGKIIRFDRSSEKQVAIARQYLDGDTSLFKVIYKIHNTLGSVFGERFYRV